MISISKHNGNVIMSVLSRPEIREWNVLKTILRISFGHQREFGLFDARTHWNESNKSDSPVTFDRKIWRCRSHLFKIEVIGIICKRSFFSIKNEMN